MKTSIAILASALSLLSLRATAQSVLFDFESAPFRSSLPISLTAGGITADLSATAQGFSIQRADTMGFTPAGFSGLCIYPNSVFAADLRIDFSQVLTDFSLLYAPEEYACDSSATMKVTAYLNGALVGANTTNAVAGTWPSETLAFSSSNGFNAVVVHYQAAPITGGDWGPIFMADNMAVTPAPPPSLLVNPVMLPNGSFQFSFTNTPDASFKVFAATNPALPTTEWTFVGTATQLSPGQYQCTDPQATATTRRFYCVRCP